MEEIAATPADLPAGSKMFWSCFVQLLMLGHRFDLGEPIKPRRKSATDSMEHRQRLRAESHISIDSTCAAQTHAPQRWFRVSLASGFSQEKAGVAGPFQRFRVANKPLKRLRSWMSHADPALSVSFSLCYGLI
jgi:hypothetical protein